MKIVNTYDMSAYSDWGKVAKAQQASLDVPWQLRLDPELRNPRAVELRNDV
jgi:hypothetical protein